MSFEFLLRKGIAVLQIVRKQFTLKRHELRTTSRYFQSLNNYFIETLPFHLNP